MGPVHTGNNCVIRQFIELGATMEWMVNQAGNIRDIQFFIKRFIANQKIMPDRAESKDHIAWLAKRTGKPLRTTAITEVYNSAGVPEPVKRLCYFVDAVVENVVLVGCFVEEDIFHD